MSPRPWRAATIERAPLLALGLALLSGLVAVAVSALVFPYHSINHDEAVYLQQASMLLEGTLFLRPPVVEAFRPWFFVRDGARLYPKYSPVPAALYALGTAAGGAWLALGAVGTAVVSLTYAVVAEAFDRRHGLLAAAFVLASPLFLVQSGTYLPYLPTLALNLTFALAYLRADRTGSRRWAALAGGAIGLAFFARPYTAVLFAAPFVVHAGWTLRGLRPVAIRRQATTAVLGLGGVALALGYNAVVTGSPWLFPYQAFAPLDGVGFGRRALLGYSVDYTPALALRSNAEVLWVFFSGWVAAGPLGTALAGSGLVAVIRRIDWRPSPAEARRLVIVCLLGSITLGNLAFWGNRNVLGTLADPSDGLIALLGPYYHVGLLLPVAALAAHGGLSIGRRLRTELDRRFEPTGARRLGVALVLLGAVVVGGTAAAVAAGPIGENRAASDQLAVAYEPVEAEAFDHALVFLPTPYGDWLNHPFQALRNDPGYEGRVLYAIEERPFDVVDATSERRVYRYGYHGEWSPVVGDPVEPRLQRVRTVSGDRVVLDVGLGVPAGVESASLRLSSGDAAAYSPVDGSEGTLAVRVVVDRGGAELVGADGAGEDRRIPIDGRGTLTLLGVFEHPDGSALTYRVELPLVVDDGVRAITPRAAACFDPTRCGDWALGLPADPPPGTHLEVELSPEPATEPLGDADPDD